MAKSRRQLLALRGDVENPFTKHVIPRDFVDFLRARTHVPASYAHAAMAAAAIVRAAGLHVGGKYTLLAPRTRPRGYACVCVAHTAFSHPAIHDVHARSPAHERSVPRMQHMGGVSMGHFRRTWQRSASTHCGIRPRQDPGARYTRI